MSNRYRKARALGVAEFEQQVEKDKDLLAAFGLRLLDVSAGVTVAFEHEIRREKINPWNCATIDSKLFEWLYPLLEELAERRESAG